MGWSGGGGGAAFANIIFVNIFFMKFPIFFIKIKFVRIFTKFNVNNDNEDSGGFLFFIWVITHLNEKNIV